MKVLKKHLRVPLLLITLFLLTWPALAKADETKELDKRIAKINAEARTPEGEARVSEVLAKELGVSPARLKKQRSETGLGWGQIFIANSLAKATGKSFNQIVSEFKSGKGFGVIAKESNVKLGRVISDLKHTEKKIKREREAQAAKAREEQRMGESTSARHEMGREGVRGRGEVQGRGRGRGRR